MREQEALAVGHRELQAEQDTRQRLEQELATAHDRAAVAEKALAMLTAQCLKEEKPSPSQCEGKHIVRAHHACALCALACLSADTSPLHRHRNLASADEPELLSWGVQWVIPGFSTLDNAHQESIQSDDFQLGGFLWYALHAAHLALEVHRRPLLL